MTRRSTADVPLVHLKTRAAWRSWLAKHHAGSRGIWLVSFKQQTGRVRIAYEDAVQEALCYGWVDSIVKRIDAERVANKFTPRRVGSRWSPSNVARFAKLVKEGRMTSAGQAHAPTVKTTIAAPDNRAAGDLRTIPAAIVRGLKRSARAWSNFEALTPSQRGLYVRWIDSAKRDDTRQRRLADAVARLERNEKLGLE